MGKPIVVTTAAGGATAGILLLFLAIVGLVAFFTGNLERWIGEIAGPTIRFREGGVVSPGGYVNPIAVERQVGGEEADYGTRHPAPRPGPRPPQRVPFRVPMGVQ